MLKETRINDVELDSNLFIILITGIKCGRNILDARFNLSLSVGHLNVICRQAETVVEPEDLNA